MSANFNPDRIYTRLAGYCQAKGWLDGHAALSFARDKHAGQTRKGGQPYIVHPLTIAAHAMALQLDDERIMCAALLHDVCEDCGVTPDELPVSDCSIKRSVELLTHDKAVPLEAYYAKIATDPVASIVKVLDRCDNVSTMAGVFAPAKLLDYIKETRTHVAPLIATTKKHWPMYSDALFVLKYHITSVIDGLELCMDMHEIMAAGTD